MSPRGELRRREILDAAVELFARNGYHDTGVADIASALRMSHGTFYRYFESKRDILDSVVDEMVGRVTEVLAVEDSVDVTSFADYRSRLSERAAALLSVLSADPRIAKLLLFEATGVDEQLTNRILDLLDSLRTGTAAVLEAGIAGGFLRGDLDVAETARAINGLIYAGAIAALRADSYPGGYVDAALALVLDGIATSDPDRLIRS